EGVVVYSQDMKFQVWNPFMEALTGVPAEAVRGRHPLELFPFLEEAGVYEQVRRALEGERSAPVVLAHRPPLATSEGWTSNASSALRNTRGEVIGAITTVRDVTREREDEEALRKLSQAIDQSPAAVVITDTDGKIEFVNPKFAQLTGYTLEEARGQNPRILKGDTPPELFEELWSTITAGRIWVGEFHNRKKDGTLYWERATLSPLKDAGGRTTHYLALKEDISDRKLLEAQLQQSQRIEAVGRLAGGIAHDFNNMLTVILNYAELTMYSLDPQDPLYANVQEIRKAAERSADLTRQLLAFSRKQIIEPQAVKLNAFFEGEKKLLGRLIGEDVSVAFVPGEGLWDVFIDPSQMDQILTNLAVNARDAIAGVGGITVSTRNAHVGADEAPRLFLEPGEYVLLTFSDTGCGMDEKTVERIFEPFFTTKEMGKGTGLGLSTVYGIVKQNRGAIHVESAPGRGTTFRLYFPRFVERRRKPRVAPQGAVPTGTETVLVVEDERRILEIAKTVLESCGYEVLVAPTPDEALRISGEHPGEIDLLLSDVVMPLMNGKDLEARVAK
ncbi:MAG: PAS domain S-box protein, partial [Deltaproteobacteria bacterium]|nr:PAS domain S-box protein [Deltaproteobacteria bacterium]